MTDLVKSGSTLPATSPEALAELKRIEDKILELPQFELRTEHVIHAGMYVRTIRLAPDSVITGALIKIPTMLIVNGPSQVLVNDGWVLLDGYNIIPASAGRKQMFIALGWVEITMIFPSKAKTVEDAEMEFTDEYEQLMSGNHGIDIINVTGE